MRRNLIVLVALAGWVYLAAPLHAAVMYQYITDFTNYNASGPGATVTVNLYLQEVQTGGSTSLIVANHGMGGAGVVDQRVGFVGATPTTITGLTFNNSLPGIGGGFGNNPSSTTKVDAPSLSAALNAIDPAGTPQGAVPDALGRILLGTETLMAGSAGSVTTFRVESFNNNLLRPGPTNPLVVAAGPMFNTVTLSLQTNTPPFFNLDLDFTNNSDNGDSATYTGANDTHPFATPYTFTVTVPAQGPTAVPEPATLLLCAVAASGAGLVRGWRRSRRRGA
jgi:hypothetical protein